MRHIKHLSLSTVFARLVRRPGAWPVLVSALLLILFILLAPATRNMETPDSNTTFSNGTEPVAPVFDDATLSSGIVFSHLQGDEHLTGMNETLGAGACAFDYDNDGWVDLFLVNGTGQTRYYGSQHWWHLPKGHAMYRNTGNGKFEDVTKQSALFRQSWGMGCTTGDLDNDGDADLLITNFGANLLYRNNGDGTFTDISETSGLKGNSWSTSAAMADYDGDGLLDIYIVNYLKYRQGAHTYEMVSQFRSTMMPSFDATLYPGESNQLYRNTGKLKFVDVTATAGVANPSGRGLGALWLDVNEDRRPDLLVTNDGGFPNTLYLNEGNGSFHDAGNDTRFNDATSSRGIAAADVDNTGNLELAIGAAPGKPTVMLFNDAAQTGLKYQDQARARGVGDDQATQLANWALSQQDFNNDGHVDLFIGNGLLSPDPDSSKLAQGQPSQLLLNQGNGRFVDVTSLSGDALNDSLPSRGVAVADFDNDGALDIYIANNNELGQLLRSNGTRGNWLGLELVARQGNRDARGSRVWLHTPKGRQLRVAGINDTLFSSSDKRLHFGLGDQTRVDKLVVEWSNGDRETFGNVPVNQYTRISQGQTQLQPLPAKSGADTGAGLKLAIGNTRPANRIRYLKWLVESQGLDQSVQELETGLADADESVRLAVIELLQKQKRPEALRIAVDALDDTAPLNRIAAVKAVGSYEDEPATRWLLRRFNDDDARVRVQVTDTFTHFFREEEAVIYRKYLAIPYLIRQLGDTSIEARAAAARALAEAENFRGVDPLIAVLTDESALVRAEAARALGLIRERKAIEALLKTYYDDTEAPVVRAHALIALKRLGYEQTNTLLAKLLQAVIGKPSGPHFKNALEIAGAILEDTDDGVVFNRNDLGRQVARMAEARYRNSPDSGSEVVARLATKVLRSARSKSGIAPLRLLGRSNNPMVSADALLALMDIDSVRAAQYAVSGIASGNPVVQKAVLAKLGEDNIRVAPSRILPLVRNNAVSSAAIKYLGGDASPAVVKSLLGLANDPRESPALRSAALESLMRNSARLAPIPARMLQHADPGLRAASLRYWSKRLPQYLQSPRVPAELVSALGSDARQVKNAAIDILLSRHEAWAERQLEQLCFNPKTDIGIRRRILDGWAMAQHPHGQKSLMRLARLRHDTLRTVAIYKLAEFYPNKIDSFMWSLLNDTREPDNIRLLAASALQPKHKKEIIEVLQRT